MERKVKRLTFELEEDLFYSLKSYCVNKKISVKDYLTNLIKNNINE